MSTRFETAKRAKAAGGAVTYFTKNILIFKLFFLLFKLIFQVQIVLWFFSSTRPPVRAEARIIRLAAAPD
jgi:hypothetical protein